MSVTKVGWKQMHLVPRFSKVGGEACVSYWMVVPMCSRSALMQPARVSSLLYMFLTQVKVV